MLTSLLDIYLGHGLEYFEDLFHRSIAVYRTSARGLFTWSVVVFT